MCVYGALVFWDAENKRTGLPGGKVSVKSRTLLTTSGPKLYCVYCYTFSPTRPVAACSM